MFTDKDKQIVRFPNSDLTADPLVLKRKFTIHTAGQFAELVVAFNDHSNPVTQAQAEESLVTATRTVLQLKPLSDKGGVPDATVLEYLAFYLEWLSAGSQKNINPFLTSQPCTDCPPPA